MKAVVLAGGQEFGQCPLSRQAPRALWPLADRTIIEHVLGALRQAGIGEMAISANGRTHDIMDSLGHHPSPDVTIHYNEDCLPRGAAGCIKDCEDWLGDETFIVVHGACLLLNVDFKSRRSTPWPDASAERLEALVAAHRALPSPPGIGRRIEIRRSRVPET